MNTEKLTPAQQVFINEMISSASRLMDKPHIRQSVNEGLEELSWLKNVLVVQHKAQRLTDITTQRKSLAPIITGEWTSTRVTMVKGKTAVHHCPPDPRLCLSAVRLDAQLSKEYEKIVGQIQNKDILLAIMQQMEAMPKPMYAFPEAEMKENTISEKEQKMLAGLSMVSGKSSDACGNSYENTLEDCGMVSGKSSDTCGNSYENTLEDCGNSYDPPVADKKILNDCDKDNLLLFLAMQEKNQQPVAGGVPEERGGGGQTRDGENDNNSYHEPAAFPGITHQNISSPSGALEGFQPPVQASLPDCLAGYEDMDDETLENHLIQMEAELENEIRQLSRKQRRELDRRLKKARAAELKTAKNPAYRQAGL